MLDIRCFSFVFVWMQCDLSDWKRVEKVAEQIKESTNRIDILLNNAGRGVMTYQLTDYGVDRHMALNHIGHAILTSQLMPLLKKTARKGNTIRIVNMASNLHESVPKNVKFHSLEELNQDLGPKHQYGRSKLAVILYTRHLNHTITQGGFPNILTNATHPGIVSTKQSREDIHEAYESITPRMKLAYANRSSYPIAGYGLSVGMEPFKKTTLEGAISMIFAATVTQDSGQYICPPAVIEPGSELSQSKELAADLVKLTKEVVKLKTAKDLVI